MTLVLECSADETLAVMVGVPRQAVVHTSGKGRVCRQLSKRTHTIGLVDEDPASAQPSSMVTFTQLEEKHDVRVMRDRTTKNSLVLLCPRLEDWVVKTAKAKKLKMTEFNLSENPRELHAEINNRLANFERLLSDLLTKKSNRLLHLQSILTR